MCQQHTRTYDCGHCEALKPRYCILVLQNGGHACEPMDIVDRATNDVCAECQMQAAQDSATVRLPTSVESSLVPDVVMGGT